MDNAPHSRGYYCGVRDSANAAICRWDGAKAWNGRRWVGTPKNLGLTWWLADHLGPSAEAVSAVIQAAFDLWSGHAALDFAQAETAGAAHIIMTAGRIDGGSGTLAWSELPCGADRQLTQKYDTAENWHWGLMTTPPRNAISAVAVMAHEIGHALGISHIAGGNLLAPTYNPSILSPQAGDIEEIQLRYGPRVVSDSPEEPDPPAGGPLTITIPQALAAGSYELKAQ